MSKKKENILEYSTNTNFASKTPKKKKINEEKNIDDSFLNIKNFFDKIDTEEKLDTHISKKLYKLNKRLELLQRKGLMNLPKLSLLRWERQVQWLRMHKLTQP